MKTPVEGAKMGRVVVRLGEAQWSKMGGEDAINSNDSFMPSKWYQIEGLIKRNSNLTKKS